ncbi:ASKHA domain-containing protein [Desulfoplanes sp.]
MRDAKTEQEIVIESGGHLRACMCDPKATLAQHLFALGYFWGRPLCSGIGSCGLCRIRFRRNAPDPDGAERNIFTPRQLGAGWRLACKHHPLSGMHFLAPGGRERHICVEKTVDIGFQKLVVDIGTTAIKWRGIKRGERGVCDGQGLNPQLGCGRDVMSRFSGAALSGAVRKSLHDSLVDFLANLIGEDEHPQRHNVVVTGNSAMIYFLLDLSCENLARAPYFLSYKGGTCGQPCPRLPEIYIPPLLSPFIGADIAAGLFHLLSQDDGETRFPFILADFGTNGEFILALGPDDFLAASVAMGPALEGVGLTRGSMAGGRVCTRFTISPAGLVPQGGNLAHGISGTGYLSLVAALRRLGVLDRSGGFSTPSQPLAKTIADAIREDPQGRVLTIEGRDVLSGRDIEEILKLKASCEYALDALVDHADLAWRDIKQVFLAGSLGIHLLPSDLVELGFVPRQLEGKIRLAGNTALEGAWDILQDREARDTLRHMGDHLTTIDLPGDVHFSENYVARMHFGKR